MSTLRQTAQPDEFTENKTAAGEYIETDKMYSRAYTQTSMAWNRPKQSVAVSTHEQRVKALEYIETNNAARLIHRNYEYIETISAAG